MTHRGDLSIHGGTRAWRPWGRAWTPALTAALLSWSLSACHARWPWDHPVKVPTPVHYVTISNTWAGSIRQYWDRNTLKLDLTELTGEGEAIVTPIESVGWPVRLEFSVRPGRFTRLEVLAAQRVVFPVPTRGRITVLKLDPGVVEPTTPDITLRWSAADDSEP